MAKAAKAAKAAKTVKKQSSIKKTVKKMAQKTTTKAAKSTVKAAPKKSAKKAASKAKPAAKSVAKSAPKAKKSLVAYRLNKGDAAPSVGGESTTGKVLHLDTYPTLVLYFYPKDNTPGCTLEGQDFRRLYSQFKSAGAEIVGVSQDSVASHIKFKEKCGFPFELLSDSNGAVCKAFDVIQMKSMYGREFEGIERSTFLIQNGVIKNEWRKVKVDGHAQAVLDAVKAL